MGSRYLVSGVQLGLLSGLITTGKTEEALETIDSILEVTYVGTSDSDLDSDVAMIKEIIDEME